MQKTARIDIELDSSYRIIRIQGSLPILSSLQTRLRTGTELSDWVPSGWRSWMNAACQEALEYGKTLEREFPTRLGRHRSGCLGVSCEPRVESRRISGVRITLLDKTKENQKAGDRHLAEKMSYLSVLASNVAHQLNNPLSSMLNRIGVLLLDDFKTMDTNSLQEELRKLQDQIYSMSIVTVALESFSEIDRSAFKLFDINTIVEKSIQLSKLVPRVADIEYKIQIKRSLPLVLGNEITIEQCLINILKNALEAMPQGGVLCVTTDLDPYESTMIRIVIQDSGNGIPIDHKERIFEPFFTTKDTSHPGLGLTVSYGIVTSHQGRISISSPKNKGTRVTILMPIAENFKRTV